MAYFQSLPLLPLFILTLAFGLAIGGLALLAVRASLRAFGVQPGQPVGLRDSLMNTTGGIFALMLAFSAAGIWNDIVQARSAVEREANALENVLALTGSLPLDLQPMVREGVKHYAAEVIKTDWPAMGQGLSVNDPVYDRTDLILVNLIDRIATEHARVGSTSLVTVLVNQIVAARSARLARITLAASGVSVAQWVAMLVLGAGVLVVIAICHNDRPKFQILATLAYATAGSAAFFVILAHDRPFIGPLAVASAPVFHLIGQ